MSGEALGWALRQSTGDGPSKALLIYLALRSDEVGGMTLIDPDYLIAVSGFGRTTVFRCLGTLRDLGLLESETGFLRSGGRRSQGRLVLSATASAMPATHASDAPAPDGEKEGSSGAGLPGGEVVREPDQGSSGAGLPDGEVVREPNQGSSGADLPTLCSNSLVIYPPNPPSAVEAETGEREGDDAQPQFEKFQRSYPFDASMRISEARKAFEALSLRDRARALRWGAAYAADLERRGATRPVDAARWLRERRFDDVEAVKGVQAKAQGLSGPRVFVAKGTRAWGAWVSHGHKPGLTCGSGTAGDSRVGWWFPSLWPPGVDPPAADGEAGCGVGG